MNLLGALLVAVLIGAGAWLSRIVFDQRGERRAGQSLRMRIEAGERAHAACFGIDWLVWVRRLSRST